ncbi:hypothetical protein CRE_22287 [Caenorhabditis remanei]|uniref:Uncharacterized protein n=1 Tax=Caenorhabditis remanei TaxID=31234 RepID=E3MDX3_CAERE|nr:hypothetical protein CRE_22287 [Caenorhabditis remanei]
MDCFEIVFDNKNGYIPGSNVTGSAIIRTSTDINARYLKICIHGAAHTKWSEGVQRHRYCDGKKEYYTEIEHYSSEVNYVNGETIAWSATNGNGFLPAGHHVFPFSFPLPVDCPPSYEGFHGHIRYSVRVELDRPWKFNKKEWEDFKVIPNFDLNYFPYGNVAVQQRDIKDIGAIFKKGIVTMTVTLPKQAYAPGEVIPITIDIDNASKRPAYCVRAELHQHSHYHGSLHSLLGTCSSHHEHHKDDSKRVVESRKNIKIAAKSQGREELKMKLPKLTPTFECPIISVEYCLSVKLDTETSMNNTLHCEFNIIIGTIPTNQPQPIVLSSSVPQVPSAPPAIERTESMPPPYFLVPPTKMSDDTAGPSAPPPTYEESVSITKV